MGLWLHKRETHIQYPNMYKLYVSCNYIHKRTSVVPATQTPAQCNSRSRDASAGPDGCAVGAVNVQFPKTKTQRIKSVFDGGPSAPSEGVFMQRCNVKNKNKKKTKASFSAWGCLHICTLSCKDKDTHARQKTCSDAPQSQRTDLVSRNIHPKRDPLPAPDLPNLSSGCSVSGSWSFCCSQSPRCASSPPSESPRGARVLEKRRVLFFKRNAPRYPRTAEASSPF